MLIEERAVLKDINTGDLPLILKWRNQDSIRNMMFNSEIITMEQHTKWFNEMQKSDTVISKLFFYDQIPFGIVNITKTNQLHKTCEWGFYIGPPNTPKGMGTILGYTALNYIFFDLEMRKLNANVLSFNRRSLSFHKKMGFTLEGKLREHILRNEKYIDIYIYGYLFKEWEVNSIELKKVMERTSL